MISPVLLALLLFPSGNAVSQTAPPSADRLSEVRQLYEAERWNDVVQAVPESPDGEADLQLYRGLSLAQLKRWEDAEKTFRAALLRHPRDARFLVELAGIAYREKRFAEAKRYLRRALAINPADSYSDDFLASIYFLQDNLEAALKYWNRADKPKLSDLAFAPQPTLNPLLLDRTFAFSRGSVWSREQFLTTEALLESLDLFPRTRLDLVAQPDGSFDLKFYGSERNAWGATKWDFPLSLLRGLPYQSVDPEFYDLGGKGLNWRSLVRWDDEKRRFSTEIAAPLGENPAIRYRVYLQGLNENWNLSHTIAPATLAGVNLEKAVAGAGIHYIWSGRWQWDAAAEYSYRKFRNPLGIPAQAALFFTNGSALAARSAIRRSLLRFPEDRFTLDSSVTGEVGTFFAAPLDRYARVQGSLQAHWLPETRGDDFETQLQLRAGRTFGNVPFDELFMLGFDRDNDLWMRGHPGLRDGEKGNAPLGRNYVLVNAETDKIVHRAAFFTVKAGPFLDTGDIFDPSGYFGSSRWMWDTGIQAKIRVLGSFEFVLGYGKDLRSGQNSFFTTVSR
ncbi:MAG TPA: tetratricopeptide repeat protein [Candidatus Acidoferrales bacterium]|nr:tetratricopeptide repeat protein [Candidatus Acidoferrales bacterium]